MSKIFYAILLGQNVFICPKNRIILCEIAFYTTLFAQYFKNVLNNVYRRLVSQLPDFYVAGQLPRFAPDFELSLELAGVPATIVYHPMYYVVASSAK